MYWLRILAPDFPLRFWRSRGASPVVSSPLARVSFCFGVLLVVVVCCLGVRAGFICRISSQATSHALMRIDRCMRIDPTNFPPQGLIFAAVDIQLSDVTKNSPARKFSLLRRFLVETVEHRCLLSTRKCLSQAQLNTRG